MTEEEVSHLAIETLKLKNQWEIYATISQMGNSLNTLINSTSGLITYIDNVAQYTEDVESINNSICNKKKLEEASSSVDNIENLMSEMLSELVPETIAYLNQIISFGKGEGAENESQE